MSNEVRHDINSGNSRCTGLTAIHLGTGRTSLGTNGNCISDSFGDITGRCSPRRRVGQSRGLGQLWGRWGRISLRRGVHERVRSRSASRMVMLAR